MPIPGMLKVQLLLEKIFSATSNDTKYRCDGPVERTFSGYFDDEEWWGLAWLRAHKLTGSEMYIAKK